VPAGSTATYHIRVHNRRARGNRLVSSLWDLTVHSVSGAVVDGRATMIRRRDWGIAELRRGRARTLVLRARVPRTAGARFCVRVTAEAGAARPDQAQSCAPIAGG
jgi:hypothetical protein